jgi:hypothetical protein
MAVFGMSPRLAVLESWKQSHDDACERRYVRIDDKLASMQEKMDASHNALISRFDETRREREQSTERLRSLMWKTALTIMSMLLGIIGYLITHSAPFSMLVK